MLRTIDPKNKNINSPMSAGTPTTNAEAIARKATELAIINSSGGNEPE